MYAIKELFYSLQGEGFHSGRPTVFVRFSGCNLWNGKEADRKNAICNFCDTDFVGTDGSYGAKYPDAESLILQIKKLWPDTKNSKIRPYVVCTGGEPLLQLDKNLIDRIHEHGFELGIETNGTLEAPEGIDWICMSPKPNTQIKLISGDELKFIFPQLQLDPLEFESLNFRHFYIQPMDGFEMGNSTQLAMEFCLKHPQWKLSLQTHKLLGIR